MPAPGPPYKFPSANMNKYVWPTAPQIEENEILNKKCIASKLRSVACSKRVSMQNESLMFEHFRTKT